MKRRLPWMAALAMVMLASSTLGCGVAAQFFPTPTPTATLTPSVTPTPSPTLTPTPPPTRTPTITPTPLPDISAAVLKLEDLPSGFEKIDPKELGGLEDALKGNPMRPQNVFTFVNRKDFQMIFGFNSLMGTSLNQLSFDLVASQPEKALPLILGGMGEANVSKVKILKGMDDIGEARIAMSVVTDAGGFPLQAEMLMFRRGPVVAVVISYVAEGKKPNITLHFLGLKVDERVKATLESMK